MSHSLLLHSKSVALFALAISGLLAASTPARAEIRQTTIDMSTFESRCRQQGGSIDTGGTQYIKICKLPNGQTVACDFITSPAYCDVYRPSSTTIELLGGNAGSMSQGTTKGPKGGPVAEHSEVTASPRARSPWALPS